MKLERASTAPASWLDETSFSKTFNRRGQNAEPPSEFSQAGVFSQSQAPRTFQQAALHLGLFGLNAGGRKAQPQVQRRLLRASRKPALWSTSTWPKADPAETWAHRGGHEHMAAVKASGKTAARPGRPRAAGAEPLPPLAAGRADGGGGRPRSAGVGSGGASPFRQGCIFAAPGPSW